MGQQFNALNDKHQAFIAQQKIFFVSTATADSKINVSPKGMESLKVLSPNRVVWLNVTGSGNETAAHVQLNSRMTIMFAAFEGNPLILRLYGKAEVIHHNDANWQEMYAHFEDTPGARQIFDLEIEMVQSSCGMAVPFYEYQRERTQLREWAEQKDKTQMEQYWEKKNQSSLDGIPTHVVQKNISKNV